jgi:alpha-L-fucosidase
MASWVAVCGEGIYGTRPWRVAGEGASSVAIEGFREDQVVWDETDVRFTAKGNTLYAFLMRASENRVALVRSLTPEDTVRAVRLLGAGPLNFSQNFGALTVKLPRELPTTYTNCLAIDLG